MNAEKENTGAKDFLENFKAKNKNVPLRNLYIFKVKDKDDNVVEEKYGVNIVVKNGYEYVPFFGGYSLKVGSGRGTYSYDRTSLFSQVGTSVTGTSINSLYPVYYDSNRNLICQYYSLAKYTLDYTFANQTFDITEFGIYYSTYSVLMTHGEILDSQGNPGSITKNLYDKMEISVLWLYVMSPDVYKRLDNLGIYGLLGLATHQSPSGGSLSRNMYGLLYADNYQPNPATNPYSSKASYQTYSQNAQVKSLAGWATFPSLLVENWYTYISDFVCHGNDTGSGGYFDKGFFIVPVYTDPEELTTNAVFCTDYASPSFEDMFQSIYKATYESTNMRGRFPVTNFEILSSYMYNHSTHQWDIEEQTTSCANSEFRMTTWRWKLEVWITDPHGISKWMYVQVNPNTSIPITSFDNSGIVLYGSDTWWDNTTWVQITNLNSLTTVQGTKKYYITESSLVLNPRRDQEYPAFIYDRTYRWSTQIYDNITSAQGVAQCCSDEYELYCTINYMFFHPEGLPGGYDQETACVQKKLTFTWPDAVVGGSSATDHISAINRHIFDDKLVVCSDWYKGTSGTSGWNNNTSGTHIRILDISDPTVNMNPNADIPYVDMQLEFTNKYYYEAGDISHRWDGDYWLSHESNANELIAVKLHGGPNEDTPTQFTIGTDIEFWEFDYGTNHIFYRKTGDWGLYHYYNLDTQTDETTFCITDFDSNVSTITQTTGYNGIIYITAQYPGSSDKYTYFYITSDDEWKVDKTLYASSVARGNMAGYNDECAVYITNWAASGTFITVINASDPFHFIQSTDSIAYAIDYSYAKGCQLKYVNNKQLLLNVPCRRNAYDESYRNIVFDIGRILDNGNFYSIPRRNFERYYVNYANYQNCIYKDTIIYRGSNTKSSSSYINLLPISNFLPHRVTITTRSLTAFNNPFRINSTDMLQMLESTTLDRLAPDPVDTTTYTTATVYRIDIFEDVLLTHRFVPCIRDDDQVKGLFDVVDQEFLEPFDNKSMIADDTTPITTDYSLPSGYTQVYSIRCEGALPNWISTHQMTNPVIHTEHTKIEWYGVVASSSQNWTCLFGTKEFENQPEHSFAFYSKLTAASFGYRRGSKSYYYKQDTSLCRYDMPIKIVCDGLTATWYMMNDPETPVSSITINSGIADDGVVPMVFLACGLTNGEDYSTPSL